MRRLTAPLLLVRGYDAPVDLTGDPAPRHVLIPLDGSEAAEQVLGPALDLGALIAGLKAARQAGGDLRIAAPTAQVETVLALTNLNRVLTAYPSAGLAFNDD
jgi:hypothetical protein